MKALHFTTHNEACGIGKYQESFLAAMAGRDDVVNDVFDVSPNVIRTLSPAEYESVMQRLVSETAAHDLLHIQHEWGFFSRDELVRAIDGAHAAGRKVVITVHTAPGAVELGFPRREGLSPRAILNYLRARRTFAEVSRNRIQPLTRADLLIVHNEATRQGLIGLGVADERIVRVILPVLVPQGVVPGTAIRSALRVVEGDVVLCTVGFLHRLKGIDAAIKSLAYLPDNYKLAIIGGLNPTSTDPGVYDELADLIRDLGLTERVHITGYVEDDAELYSLVRECDIALYPYDNHYYSQVSSAALTVALGNAMPIVAYPIATFRELNQIVKSLQLTDSFSYYELAREVRSLDATWPNPGAVEYAERNSFAVASEGLIREYQRLS